MTAGDIAVETQGLTKIYGSGNTEVVAMRDVTFCVRRGEVAALLGPSGAGKSTLLTAIGLINPPTSGRVLINGRLVMAALLFGFRPADVWEMELGQWLRFADYIDDYRAKQAKAR